MKIAFIYDATYPWVKGGAEKRIYEIAHRLALKGHEIHCYSWGWWWPENGKKDLIFKNIHLHGVGKPHDLYHKNRRSISEAIMFAIKLWPKIQKENFDVIDCQGFPYFSCFTAKLHSLLGKSKLIITVHEVWGNYWYDYLGKLGIFGKLIENLMFRLTNRIITVSNKTQQDLLRVRKVPEAKIIPNGINFKEIEVINPKQEKNHIIFSGRLIKEKRVDLLIKSLPLIKEEIQDLKVVIIGEGPELTRLKQLAENLELSSNISFIGFLSNHSDLISLIKSSEVFVLPSEREGFGIVVLEANACGIPVVTVNNPHNAAVDLIDQGKNGFIAEAYENDLKDKIINAILAKGTMKEYCMEYAKKYDWDVIIKNLEKYYQEEL
ncbi:MAG: L-malate glycosyltransferase [Methanobacterium sp.]|uniref:glycosyltransferase family 4 protein n=1 Tax=Methanobacterium sp. TaxID=2164 RepID=UPI0024AC4BFE|nr:glycosyltransferase family 4 protein [Methanobacterium sp.]MDI3549598.1 L-malate glycosyltransferase [Methanobacterium sp.]